MPQLKKKVQKTKSLPLSKLAKSSPSTKNQISSFQMQQRRLVWLMLLLTALASLFMFFLSWQFSRLDVISPFLRNNLLPLMSAGEILEERPMSFLPSREDGLQRLSFQVSPDGRSFAYILKNNESEQVVLNEIAGPLFDEIIFMSFSPDSKNFAYIANKDRKAWPVINGEIGQAYDFILEPRLFSPDSRYFIYKARKGTKDVLVINGRESRPYDLIYNPFVTSDNSAIVFFALDGNRLWRGEIPLSDFDR
jgi:hypothetical protein